MLWDWLWTVAGGTILSMVALFLMVGGGFFLALLVLTWAPVVWAAVGKSPATTASADTTRIQPWPDSVDPTLKTRPAKTPAPGPGIPAAAFVSVLALGTGIALVHAYLGLYHLTVITLLAVEAGTVALLADTVPVIARRVRTELALVNHLTARGSPMTLQVVAAKGRCAWGYQDADRWAIAPDGLVTPRVCQAVASSLSAALKGSESPPRDGCTVRCQCPLAGREVTFVARPMAATAA